MTIQTHEFNAHPGHPLACVQCGKASGHWSHAPEPPAARRRTATSRVEFVTTEYEWAHRRKPRGGEGWAFAFVRRATEREVFFTTGKYSEAKKQAAAKAREVGASTIYVQS